MRLMKMFGFAALAAVAAMAFVGATSASAETNTVLCSEHGSKLKVAQLLCPADKKIENVPIHAVLATGTVGKLLSPVNVLCLGVLVESTPLSLGNPLQVHTLKMEFTGCGTSSTHNNCTVTVEEFPLNTLLKTGLDAGSLEAQSGKTRLVCANIGINCVYDLEGSLFAAGNQHLTADETPTIELGGKFFCPDEGFLDGLLKLLTEAYVLQ